MVRHWKCRNLAKWMRDHPKLKDLYVQGKMIKNPSGRTFEINRGYRAWSDLILD